ncbi:MAG: outer membrane protein transport protein [Anaeromyxobacteraceae bacterium]
MRTLKIAILSALLVPALASASGFEVINTNPRDLSLAGSGVAAQRDAAATFQNPASLTRIPEGLNLSLAGSMLSLKTKWTAPSDGTSGVSGDATTNFAPTPPVALFLAYGLDAGGHRLGIGGGLGVPGGGQMKWDEDWQGRGRIITVERRVLGAYLNAGFEITPMIRVGGGLIYYYGIQYLKQGIEPFQGSFGELSANGGGLSFQLAADVQVTDKLRLGVDFKNKATMKTKGDGHFSVPDSIASAATQDQGVSEDLPFPMQIAAGASYQVSKAVLVTLQYNYAGFNVYKEDKFVGDKGLTLIVPRDYGDGHVVRGGVEWTVNPSFELRFGLMRDFSGLKTDTLSPTLPDSNTTGLTTGFTWKASNAFALSWALFYGDRDKQTATGAAAFPGSYKTNIWITGLGFTWSAGQ